MKRKKKPTANRKPKPKSRMFEELIARIEDTLVPQGALVKSPDFIPDKVTGSLREVDGSIRYQVGSTPILITIECRRRSTKDDARWIEQLRSKKEDIGALQTIAVSWKGFGQPAIIKAAKYGIELRTYKELTVDGIQKLQQLIRLTCVYVEYKFAKAFVQFNPPVTGLEMSDEHIQRMDKEGVKYPFVIRKSDGVGITLVDMLDLYQAQNGPIDKGLKPGEETSADFSVTFAEGLAEGIAGESEDRFAVYGRLGVFGHALLRGCLDALLSVDKLRDWTSGRHARPPEEIISSNRPGCQ